MGSRRLRDIARPVELFQVRAAGLRADFPPLKTADVDAGQPAATDHATDRSGVGTRRYRRSALKANRLVTLTGVGGVGKTRLALEVAARSAPDFPDGVWVIELAAVTDPAAVPDAVAGVLGITQQPGMTMADSVAVGAGRAVTAAACSTTASTSWTPRPTSSRRSSRARQPSRSSRPVGKVSEWPTNNCGRCRRWTPTNPTPPPRLSSPSAPKPQSPGVVLEPAAVQEICRRLDGIPLGNRVGRVANGVDDGDRGAGSAQRPVPAAGRVSSWAGAPSDAAPRRAMVLRPTRRWRADAAQPMLGLRRRLRSGGRVCGDRLRGRVRHAGLARCPCAQVASGCRPVIGAHPILDAGDHSPVRRGSTRRRWPGRGASRCACALLRRTRSRCVALWDSPRQREAYEWFTTELPNLRAAFRWAADRGRPRHRRCHRPIRGIPWAPGRAVRAGGVGRGTHRTGEVR